MTLIELFLMSIYDYKKHELDMLVYIQKMTYDDYILELELCGKSSSVIRFEKQLKSLNDMIKVTKEAFDEFNKAFRDYDCVIED